IRDGNGQRAAAAAHSYHCGDDGYFQSGHFAEIIGNRFRLTSLLRMNSRVGPVCIDESEDRAVKLLGNLHDANRLAVSLGMRSSKVPVDALLHVPAFLSPYHHDFVAVEAGHPADDGGIITKTTVAVDFAEVGKDSLNIVERLRTLRVPGQFGFVPRGRGGVHLLP